MSPISFVLSTVLPAVVMAVVWLLGSRQNFGRKLMPLVFIAAFVGGLWQLAGPPQPQWPMVIMSFLVYFGLATGLLEATVQGGHKRWNGILGILLVGAIAFSLRARLLESGVWEGSAFGSFAIVSCVLLALFTPGLVAIGKMASLGVRASLILTGVAMSVVLLASGSALMAQTVGICVALQCAIVAVHLVLSRKSDLAPNGLLTVYGLYALFIILGYYFVEIPKWPWLLVCASIVASPLASYRRQDTLVISLAKAIGVSLPALIAAIYVVQASLATSTENY